MLRLTKRRLSIHLPFFRPGLGQTAAFGAMAVAARVVRDAHPAAVVALVHMTAEYGRATLPNIPHHQLLLERQAVLAAKLIPIQTEDVSHLKTGAVVSLDLCGRLFRISNGAEQELAVVR